MEKFTFTDEIYSLILLLPKWKRSKAIHDVIQYGLYDILPKTNKRYQPIMDNIITPLRDEKAKRFIAQVNGEKGGRGNKATTPEPKETTPKVVIKPTPKQNKAKVKQNKAKTNQIRPSKLDVSLFCIGEGYNLSDSELTSLYRSILNSDDWRRDAKEQLINL